MLFLVQLYVCVCAICSNDVYHLGCMYVCNTMYSSMYVCTCVTLCIVV